LRAERGELELAEKAAAMASAVPPQLASLEKEVRDIFKFLS
jgi:hypothetical protein